MVNFLLTSGIQLDALTILYIIVGVLLSVVLFAALFARIFLVIKYGKYNRKKVDNGLTGETASRILLDNLDLQDVEVKKNNWLQSLLWGNHYSTRKKRIGLRGGVFNNDSVTAVGLACQKAALAKQHKEGNKMVKVRGHFQPYVLLAPIMLFPLVLVGLVLDLLLFNFTGICTFIFLGVGLLYYLFAFVFSLITFKVEKRANKEALVLMEKTNFLNEEYREDIKQVFKYYEISYFLEFIAALLYFIKYVLKLLMQFQKLKK